MSVNLPNELRSKLVLLVGEALRGGATAALLFGGEATAWTQAMPVGITAGLYALTLVKRAQAEQAPGSATGPFIELLDYLDTLADPAADQLRACVGASAAEAAGVDPYDSRLAGPLRRPLLDHDRIRHAIRATVEGNLPVVWVPPPLLYARQPLVELATLTPQAWRTREFAWDRAVFPSARDLATALGTHFKLGTLPPAGVTTVQAEIQTLAGWLVQGLQDGSQDTLVVFSAFQAPDCPADCLQLLSWMSKINASSRGSARLALILLDFEPGTSWVADFDLGRTQADALDPARLRAEAEALLRGAGLPDAKIAALLDPLPWAEPLLDLARVHALLREALA